MKSKKLIAACFFLITILACSRKLDLKTIENAEIILENYEISEISTVHEFVDITNKRWNRTERICEANVSSIDTIFIKNDSTIIIKPTATALFYDLAALKFGYRIIVEK